MFGEVLARKLVVVAYTALIVLAPSGSAVVLQVAVPLASGLAPQAAMSLPPTLNATVPVAVPVPGVVVATVTVKMTLPPSTDGLVPEVTSVAVAALLTTWVMSGEVLISSWCCPRTRRHTVAVPTASVLSTHVAVPPTLSGCAVQVPTGAAFRVNATAPDGVVGCRGGGADRGGEGDGLTRDARGGLCVVTVLVSALLTVWVRVGEVLVFQFVAPL